MFKLIDEKNINDVLKSLRDNSIVSIDTETNSLDIITCIPLLIQIKIGEEVFIFDARKQKELIRYIFAIIKDSNKLCVFHNAKFDLKVIYRITNEWLKNVYDTMIAEVLIHQGIGKQYYSLDELVELYLKKELDKTVRDSFINFPPEQELTQQQLIYSAMDVQFLEEIRTQQKIILDQQKQLKVLDLENRLTPVIAKMEFNGIGIDEKQWADLESKWIDDDKKFVDGMFNLLVEKIKPTLEKRTVQEVVNLLCIPVKRKKDLKVLEDMQALSPFEKEIQFISWLKENFNFDSKKQCLFALNNFFGMELDSTLEKKITKFKNEVKFIELLLNHRELEKRSSTYGVKFLKDVHPVTKRIHSEFNQVGTYTGRFSSSRPDMQNIPKLQEYRSCFIARPGYKIITADYSQAELRIMAWVSREPEMINSFLKNEDLHKKSATFLFKKAIEDITADERKYGKALNFGLIYGITPYGLYYNFGIPFEDGESYHKSYFEGYKVLKYFIDKAGDIIIKQWFSTTPLGRKRFFEKKVFFEDYRERDRYIARIRREGVNHIIQGGSADAIKEAMVRIEFENPFPEDYLNILIQVHDELVIEVREDIVEEAKNFIARIMSESEKPFIGIIDALVDLHTDICWSKE